MKLWRLVAGIALILLGIIGLIMPILPGWVFFFIGLSLLGIGGTSLAQRLKKKMGLEEVDSPMEDYNRIPTFYRTGLFIILILIQIALLIVTILFADSITDINIVITMSSYNILYFIFPLLAFLLCMIGLFISTYWTPEDMDYENDIWVTYFTLEVVTLPIFWALMIYLTIPQ